jgi:hypothetical protein
MHFALICPTSIAFEAPNAAGADEAAIEATFTANLPKEAEG